MSTLSSSHIILGKRDIRAIAGWTMWALFVIIWVIFLVPFYTRGLHQLADASFAYAGVRYTRFGTPLAPLHEEVYGTPAIWNFAQSVVCLAPCVFKLTLGAILWRLVITWRSYSRLGRVMRTSALIVMLMLGVLSIIVARKFAYWGLG
jgi:hypothetical protein